MPEEKNILSLSFDLSVREVETSDDAGNSVIEECYTITCGDVICWSVVSDKGGDEREHTFTGLQVRHVIDHLRERLEHAAHRLGKESHFIAWKRMPLAKSNDWKNEGQKFLEERVKSDQARMRRLLSVRRGQPQRMTKAQQSKLPARYDALHAKFKGIKKRHNDERKRVEREKNRGLSYDQWLKEWLPIAKGYYPKERHEYLELIANIDKTISSPSNVALFVLARETGYEPKYLGRLLTAARKLVKEEKSNIIRAE